MEEDWDPVPPYPGRSQADVEKQLVAMRQYEHRTPTGTRGRQPPVTMETIPEGPTIEGVNGEVCSNATPSSKDVEEQEKAFPKTEQGKPEEPLPDDILINKETLESPKPQLSPRKPISTSFVHDTPPHQTSHAADYDTGYTNPYQHDNHPGFGTSSYPHIPNKGKQRAEPDRDAHKWQVLTSTQPEVSFDDRIPRHSKTVDLEEIDLEVQQGIIDSFIENERHKDMGTQSSAFKSQSGSFEKFFTPNASARQPPTSPISVSLAGFESNSAAGNPPKTTSIPVAMTSGGGGSGNDPPDAGDNPGYESDDGPDDNRGKQSSSHRNSPNPSNSGLVEMFEMVGMDREFERRLKEIERDELNQESKLDINKPSLFTGED
ncbi:hypothetical protein EV360DRAFT_84913 [Lentinula raphanica]|nr:hypothetical protein EV360DRAFT_84913 [Lentinula raphanica]